MNDREGRPEREAVRAARLEGEFEPIKMTGVVAPRKKHNFSLMCGGRAGKEENTRVDPLTGDREQCSHPLTKLFLIL